MSTNAVNLKSQDPFVVLPLERYESLLNQIEELEDKMALITQRNEEEIPWDRVEKKFEKKFGKA